MISAVLQPFWLAFFRGAADPPPHRSTRLRRPMPGPLRRLLPFDHYDVVQVADLVLAWVLFGTSLSELLEMNGEGRQPLWLVYLAAVAFSLPVALRDRWPLAAWRLALVLLPPSLHVVQQVTDMQPPYLEPAVVMYLLVLYSVAARCDRRITAVVWLTSVLTVWIVDPNSTALSSVAVTVIVLFGYNVRVRRRATASRDAAVGQRFVMAERARIARELHDVVAHHLSVIAIQAEAVPMAARGDAARLEEGLAQIRGLSLEAIKELRQVLGVLRDQEGRADTTPAPALDRLDELVGNARSAGLTVLVRRSGELEEVPTAMAVSAYRIVQESLSNAMRHAPGSAVAVELVWAGDLRVRVANGPGRGPGATPGAGHGLMGMRERATLLGGSLEAGPTEEGGFEVKATLPLERSP
ncbi:sensor histidine kinase [Nonomuraea sp. NPDC059194]|uniref:sensor histidine kinase n=1 Tax=Nonomuraea sp. NPDC059194 TaxID=3346764 RepID=UPI00367B1505